MYFEKRSTMQEMKTHTGSLFRNLRTLFGYTQIEMASRLNVSQSTISKVESEVFVPELTLWFDFVREFGLLDPYCFYYGTAELRDIPNLFDANKTGWHGVWAPKHKKKMSMTVRALGPLLTHLKTHAPMQIKTLLSKNGATPVVLTVLNYPVPWDVVWGLFELAQDCKVSFNLANLAPQQSEQGFIFSRFSTLQTREDYLEFVRTHAGDYFGSIQLGATKEEVEGIPANLKKPFRKYLSDYPAHIGRARESQLIA
jgi:DNA-binding XRE family transcriptional regulator